MENSYHILILDDQKLHLMVLEKILQKLENTIIHKSSNASTALDILENHTEIDLIITDIQMPNIDGFDFVNILKSKYPALDIPIIFLTATFKAEEFEKKGFDLGAVDFLSKPVVEHRLINRVKLYRQITQKQKALENIHKDLDKRANQKSKILSSLNKNFKIAQEIGKIGHFEIDTNGAFVFWSREIYKILEIDDHNTNPCFSLYFEMIDDVTKNIVKKSNFELLNNHKSYVMTFNIKTQKNNIKMIKKTCQAIYNKDGSLKYFIGILQDITNKTKLENNLINKSKEIADISTEIQFVSKALENEIDKDFSDIEFKKTVEETQTLIEQRKDLKKIREKLFLQQEILKKQSKKIQGYKR